MDRKSEKCPICSEEMFERIDYLENCIGESTKRCVNRCFSENFHYGTTEIMVFEKEFCYSYDSPKKLVESIKKDVRKEIEYLKRDSRYLIQLISNK